MAPAEPTGGPQDSRPQERRTRRRISIATHISLPIPMPKEICIVKPDSVEHFVISLAHIRSAADLETAPRSQAIAAICASPFFSIAELEAAVTGLEALVVDLKKAIQRRRIRDEVEDEMHRAVDEMQRAVNGMKRKLDTQHEEFVTFKRRQADEMIEKRWQERLCSNNGNAAMETHESS